MKSAELRKVNRWLREHQKRIADLAARAGLTRTTVYNLLSGVSKSRVARQKLTNAIRIIVWKGCTPQAVMTLNPNDPSSLKQVDEAARESPSGIQFEVQSESGTGGRRELPATGFLGRDGRGVLLPAGTEIELNDAQRAREAVAELPRTCFKRRGRIVTFTKPVHMAPAVDNRDRCSKKRHRKLSASSYE